jgi:hypothetical protein
MPKRTGWQTEAWVWLLFALPFLLAAHLLKGLHEAILTFHGTDELEFHLPAILKFAQQWPHVVLRDYSSATTPLFHLIFSGLGQWLGFELERLRAVNVGISFTACLIYYRLWRDQLHVPRSSAALLTLLFLLSPYFFGVSFILLTDNLAWLFCLAAVYLFLASAQSGRMGAWCLGAIFLCLTLLTRQSFAWLLPCIAWLAWTRSTGLAERLVRLAALLLACAPLGALVALWHGLVPPSFQRAHEAHAYLNLRSFEFSLALIGFYLPLLQPWQCMAVAMRRDAVVWAGLVVAVALLLVAPLGHQVSDDGFVWRMSAALPDVAGSSLLFWALLPAGCVGLIHLVLNARDRFGTWALLAFIVSMLPSGLLFQKYTDPFIPVCILMATQEGRPLDRTQLGIVGVLILCFVAYALLPYRHFGG